MNEDFPKISLFWRFCQVAHFWEQMCPQNMADTHMLNGAKSVLASFPYTLQTMV